MKIGNACLDGAFDTPEAQVRRLSETFIKANQPLTLNTTLVGTGFSGALVVPTLGRELGLDYLLVRKPGDSHHHGDAIGEGNFNESGKWIFVDDGIGTGTTYRRVRAAVNRIARDAGLPDEFQGAYLYGDPHSGFPADFWTPGKLFEMGITP